MIITIIVKMVMQNGMIKLSADTEPETVELIDKASDIEGRTRASFMRFHLKNIAKKIIHGGKK